MKRKRKNLPKLFISTILIGTILMGYSFLFFSQINKNKTLDNQSDKAFGWKFPIAKFPLTGASQQQLAYSDIRDPGGIPQGLPVRLKIPIIGVDSAIEDALITNDGRMDVPIGSVNVAWFSLGPQPGQIGSAVIGGHFGIENETPFVFYNLDKLKVGDKVYILDDKGDTLAFIVRRISSFDRNADASTVFTSSDGLVHLNLITCEGIWNQVNDSYPQRLVIFTDAIPSEGAVVVDKSKIAGKTIAPTDIPTGSLEKTTKQPAKKQAPTSSQVLIDSAQSLYKTPLDTVITSFLILSIFFSAVKIIRR